MMVWAGLNIMTGHLTGGVLMLIAAGFVLGGYFRYGSVWTAFRHMQRGDIDKAETIANKTRHPDGLNAEFKSCYHWIRAAAATQREEFETARDEYQKALAAGPRTENNRNILAICLAEIEFALGDNEAATERLAEIRSGPLTSELEEMIERVEEQHDT